MQTRSFAARKGYREQAKKKKVKTVIKKQAWIPHNLRKGTSGDRVVTHQKSHEHKKQIAQDDVFVSRYYAWRVFDFKEAVNCHREIHHPTILNLPDSQVNLLLEMDMTTAKSTKFVDKFKKMAILPHIFEQDDLTERSILVFCKTNEQKEAAMAAGANLVGGSEIIRDVEKGKIVLPDFRFVIAHPSILPEMISIRGLLKRKFPSLQLGTLGPNIAELVTQFKNGVEYACVKDEKTPEFGWINTTIGRLNMEDSQLEENFQALVNDINTNRPKRPGPFITRVIMSCPPSTENLKVNIEPYLEEKQIEDDSSDEDEAIPAKA
ncbi:39S ribosomal protein L1, mitochondrial-like [Macrosteles quadrilineatus]|nr:39S ribosomal protein L1, mitochondrial-like [Macrosteles quadrilineatus]